MSDECPGAGKCHGCLKWCDECGDVQHVCDARLDGHRCDSHPVPPEAVDIIRKKRDAEARLWKAEHEARRIRSELTEIADEEAAREAFNQQLYEQQEHDFGRLR